MGSYTYKARFEWSILSKVDYFVGLNINKIHIDWKYKVYNKDEKERGNSEKAYSKAIESSCNQEDIEEVDV